MDCTTQPQIHARFRAVIEAIVPVYSYLGDVPWAYVAELPGAVSGPPSPCGRGCSRRARSTCSSST